MDNGWLYDQDKQLFTTNLLKQSLSSGTSGAKKKTGEPVFHCLYILTSLEQGSHEFITV